MTEKLFYTDSHMQEFTAEVVSCRPCDNGYEAVLSRTAFFPEGGGQAADTGVTGSEYMMYRKKENRSFTIWKENWKKERP